MAKRRGVFIVLEGTDGSGKATQFLKLVTRLKESGREPAAFDFPRYGQPSAYFVEQYLNGAFGGLTEISPKTASLFYALDRYAAAPEIREALAEGRIVISNRYVASNLGHQGSKMKTAEERKTYFEWDMALEFEVNNIPRPDLNIILRVPAAIAQTLVDQKLARTHLGGKKRDLHETDLNHLLRTEETYKQLAGLYPNEFIPIECVEGDRLLSVEEVHEKVWRLVRPRLK